MRGFKSYKRLDEWLGAYVVVDLRDFRPFKWVTPFKIRRINLFFLLAIGIFVVCLLSLLLHDLVVWVWNYLHPILVANIDNLTVEQVVKLLDAIFMTKSEDVVDKLIEALKIIKARFANSSGGS